MAQVAQDSEAVQATNDESIVSKRTVLLIWFVFVSLNLPTSPALGWSLLVSASHLPSLGTHRMQTHLFKNIMIASCTILL